VLSLFVALHAIVAQQWLEDYSFRINEPAANHRRWVWRHLVFSAGFERWKIDAFISALPLLLHLSLLMFIMGLVLFLVPIDTVAAVVIVTAAGAGFVFYLVVTFIPVFWRDCPTATPLLRLVLYIYHLIEGRFAADRQKTPDTEKGVQDEAGDLLKDQSSSRSDEQILIGLRREFDLDIDALCWMIKYLPTVDDINAALDAVGGLSPLEKDLSVIPANRKARFIEINRALEKRVEALSVGIAAPEPAAIARTLRTSVALAAVNRQLDLQSPMKKHPKQLLYWMENIPEYDVFWLCQILGRLDELPEWPEISVDNVTDWYLDGGILRLDRACLRNTHSLLLKWHLYDPSLGRTTSPVRAISTAQDTVSVAPTTHERMLPVLKAFFCMEAVHAVTQRATQADMQTNQRLVNLCWSSPGDSLPVPALVEPSTTAHPFTVGISLLVALPYVMQGQETQLLRLCADLVSHLPLKPLEPLQPKELSQLLDLAQHAFRARDATDLELSKRVLQLLEGLFSRNLVTASNWTAQVGVLLQKGLNTLINKHSVLDAASILGGLPTAQHLSCSWSISDSPGQAIRERLGLLKKSTDLPSPWRLVIMAADNAFPWPKPSPESLVQLALELISLLPEGQWPTPIAPEENNWSLTSTEALEELLGTPQNALQFKTLLRTKQTNALVHIMRHAKNLDKVWYDRFISAWTRRNDGWLAFYGNEVFERVDAALDRGEFDWTCRLGYKRFLQQRLALLTSNRLVPRS